MQKLALERILCRQKTSQKLLRRDAFPAQTKLYSPVRGEKIKGQHCFCLLSMASFCADCMMESVNCFCIKREVMHFYFYATCNCLVPLQLIPAASEPWAKHTYFKVVFLCLVVCIFFVLFYHKKLRYGLDLSLFVHGKLYRL